MQTWNIVFIGIDICENKKDSLIEQTKVRFLSTFSHVNRFMRKNNFNFICLNYINNSGTGSAELTYNIPGTTKVQSEATESKDWYSADSYTGVISPLIQSNTSFADEKLLVIFVAHSFGAGFAASENNNTTRYLTTENLRQVLKGSFGGKKTDCLLALNCAIQSVETNLILKDDVSFIIGSQIALFPDTISFRHLKSAIRFRQRYGDELMWVRFLYDCFDSGALSTAAKSLEIRFRKFNLSLSNPALLAGIEEHLNVIGSLLHKDNNDSKNTAEENIISRIIEDLEDPNPSSQGFIYDCRQLFKMIGSQYKANADIAGRAAAIAEVVKQAVIFTLNSSNASITDLDDRSGGISFFVPQGIGIFFPDRRGVRSVTIRSILNNTLSREIEDGQLNINDTLGSTGISLKEWFEYVEFNIDNA